MLITLTWMIGKVMIKNEIFCSKATDQGNRIEPVARKSFLKRFHKVQSNCVLAETVLWAAMQNAIIAASPDGLVNCACCGTGLVKI